jgi:hypothetical protein
MFPFCVCALENALVFKKVALILYLFDMIGSNLDAWILSYECISLCP